MAEISQGQTAAQSQIARAARRDIYTGAIVVAAILMFAGTGTSVMSAIMRNITGVGGGSDRILTVALLLNIALILFGWRRYRDLQKEVRVRTDAEERAQILALHDPLTGFHNRRSIAESGSQMLAKAARRGKSVAMLMLDLDNFKTINDVHGHAVGDALLRSVAAEVTKIVPPSALTARLGGDEFACCFVYDGTNRDTVDRIANDIVTRLSQPIDAAGTFSHISVSIGIAHSAGTDDTIDALMRRADIAMYAAKHQGRNRASWFDASMERELQTRSQLETDMRTGIPAGEFEPYFEQQVDLTTGTLQGFEMLARWNHPTRGLMNPEVFIPIAEETGMIGDLSFSLMRKAFEEAKNWDASLIISVNISPTQLRDPWLAQKVVKLLVETGFPANRLEIEITESSLFDNLQLAQSIVASLKNQGIRLALDDFGTGYSSLAHLRALPFDRIKIDKSFVTSLIGNADSDAIVNAITRLGENLSMPITAEGIEDADIAERLREIGCNKGQGWHYGKPIPVGKVRGLLAERDLLPAMRLRATDAEAPPESKRRSA